MLGETGDGPSVQRSTSEDHYHERQTGTFIPRSINRERLVPVLETIAIRAVVYAPAIQPLDAFKSRHFIYQARREQHLTRPESKTIGARN
jgi:hypothetical protein